MGDRPLPPNPWAAESAKRAVERALAEVDALPDDEFQRRLTWYHNMLAVAQNGRVLDVIGFEDVTEEEPDFLWEECMALGTLTTWAGEPGEGKTWATIALIACVTNGWAVPGTGITRTASKVLYLNAEDSIKNVIKYRMRGSGVYGPNLKLVNGIIDADMHNPFTNIVKNGALMADHLGRHPGEYSLVVIDPVTAFLGETDEFRRNEVEMALAGLKRMAEQYQVAILLVMHLRKGDAQTILHRVSGSGAFVSIPRAVALIGTHPQTGRKSIDFCKHNLSRIGHPPPMEFTVTRLAGFEGEARFMGPAPDLSAAAIERARLAKVNPREAATAFLLRWLADGPRTALETIAEASSLGIATHTLQRARIDLGVTSKPIPGFQAGREWSLPSEDPEPYRWDLASDHSEPLAQYDQELFDYAADRIRPDE